MKKKPYIRISRLRRAMICSGLGCTGSGESFRAAWLSWADQMIQCGRARLVPGLAMGKKS